MRQRTLVAVTTTLATLGLVLTASAAPQSHSDRPAPARVTIDGLAGDWDADASSITIVDPDVHGGSRAARRVLRSLDEIDLAIGPRTRIVTEDEDGVRERIDAETLFADLDASADDLEIEAGALVARGAGAADAADPVVTAKRIVVYLPPADDATDPADDSPDDPEPPAAVEDPAPAPPALPAPPVRGRR